MKVKTKKTSNKYFKKILKRGLQHVAASFGRHTRIDKNPQLLILMYHRVLPHDDARSQIEEPGMTVTPDTFRSHLEIIKNYFDIVKLSDWIQLKHTHKPLPAKACAITFDDGWADNFEYAFPVLKELDVPATIFLVSDMIGTSQQFWPERLARIVTTIAGNYPQFWSHPELEWLMKNPANYQFSATQPTREELSELIACVKVYPDQQIHERLTHIENSLQLDTGNTQPPLLNWQTITEMLDSGLVEVGSHTCQHIRLNKYTPKDQIRHEIVNSQQVIEKNTGQKISIFCYPNGDLCPEALSLVKQNYTGAVTTNPGWNSINTDSHLLHRIAIHEDISADKTSFLARISGWL